jgi:signal transduction histidine kinase
VLRRSPEELVIEVRDDGANGATASSEGGYGLLGMRERLALYGGTLEAGPQPERGYAIVARLPTVDP